MDELNQLSSVLGAHVYRNESLERYCKAGTGGLAKYLFVAENIEALILAVMTSQKIKIPYRVIGAGGGILFSDSGYSGMIIINKASRIFSIPGTNIISCDSGITVSQIINFAAERGLSGLESFSNLSGSIGGAVYNNARVKVSICDFLHSVTLITDKGKIVKRDPVWLNCQSRSTRLMHGSKNKPWTILVVSFRFQRRRPEDIQEEILAQREGKYSRNETALEDVFLDVGNDKAVDVIRNSGANKLRVGGAEVIPNKCNCIKISRGATSQDVRKLIEQIRDRVFEKCGLQLIESIEYFGLWH